MEKQFFYRPQIPIFLSYVISNENTTLSLAKTSTKSPVFQIKTVSCTARMIFTCFLAKFRYLWLQNIAKSQLESLEISKQ